MIDSRTLAKTALNLAQGPEPDAAIKRFVSYLRDYNLVGLMPQILRHLERENEAAARKDTLEVFTRYPLSKALMNQLKDLANAQDATVVEHKDEALLGGFRATYRGKIYDGSVKTQLDRLRTKLTS